MQKEIQEYMQGCRECQQNKVNTHQACATLCPIFLTLKALPFKTVAMDFIVKLPPSGGYNSVLTVTNHNCLKATVFIPCNKMVTAEEVAGLYLTHVF